MIRIPTFSSSAAGTFVIWGAGANGLTVTDISQDATYTNNFNSNVYLAVASGVVAGNITMWMAKTDATAYIDFSAEF
jgi:hypothetical protein